MSAHRLLLQLPVSPVHLMFRTARSVPLAVPRDLTAPKNWFARAYALRLFTQDGAPSLNDSGLRVVPGAERDPNGPLLRPGLRVYSAPMYGTRSKSDIEYHFLTGTEDSVIVIHVKHSQGAI